MTAVLCLRALRNPGRRIALHFPKTMTFHRKQIWEATKENTFAIGKVPTIKISQNTEHEHVENQHVPTSAL